MSRVCSIMQDSVVYACLLSLVVVHRGQKYLRGFTRCRSNVNMRGDSVSELVPSRIICSCVHKQTSVQGEI